MASSDTAFAGSIPEFYDRCLGPFLFEPYAADLAARAVLLRPRRVLETAAGTGIVTAALAEALPEAEIVATACARARRYGPRSKPELPTGSKKRPRRRRPPWSACTAIRSTPPCPPMSSPCGARRVAELRAAARGAALLALPLALASCQMGVEVTVSGPPSAPLFEMAEAGWFGGDPPAIDSLSVRAALGGGAWQVLWKVDASNGCVATARVRYGEAPTGYAQAAAAARLEPGRAYVVEVGGCGHFGGTWFKSLGRRLVFEPGSSDESRRKIEGAR